MATLFILGLLDIAGWLVLRHVVASTEEFSTPRIILMLSIFAIDFWLFVAFVAYFMRMG